MFESLELLPPDAIIGLIGHFAGAPDVVMFTAWSIAGIGQNWFIKKAAAVNRLNARRKRSATAKIPVRQS